MLLFQDSFYFICDNSICEIYTPSQIIFIFLHISPINSDEVNTHTHTHARIGRDYVKVHPLGFFFGFFFVMSFIQKCLSKHDMCSLLRKKKRKQWLSAGFFSCLYNFVMLTAWSFIVCVQKLSLIFITF